MEQGRDYIALLTGETNDSAVGRFWSAEDAAKFCSIGYPRAEAEVVRAQKFSTDQYGTRLAELADGRIVKYRDL